jgi:hypothetical protein
VQLSYGVLVVWHTYHAAPQGTLDAGVQDATRQGLTTICEELRDLDNRRFSEKEEYVQKTKDLLAWARVQERKIQALQALNSAQKAVIQSLWGQLQKIGEGEDDDLDDPTLDDYDVEDY